jgi:hypothetical protein
VSRKIRVDFKGCMKYERSSQALAAAFKKANESEDPDFFKTEAAMRYANAVIGVKNSRTDPRPKKHPTYRNECIKRMRIARADGATWEKFLDSVSTSRFKGILITKNELDASKYNIDHNTGDEWVGYRDGGWPKNTLKGWWYSKQ